MIAAIYAPRTILVTLLCCLLAMTTSASAECAWVLWVESASMGLPGTGIPTEWRVVGTASSEVECRRAAIDKTKSFGSWSPEGFAINAENQIIRHVCLPDTVDPRGPKGR